MAENAAATPEQTSKAAEVATHTGPIFKKTIEDTMANAIERATNALKANGFGVLTRLDMHEIIKKKIDKDMIPTVLLGACNPHLAYQAVCMNSDITSVLPCNAVLREVEPGTISVEFARPSTLLGVIGDNTLVKVAADADCKMKAAHDSV